LNFIYVRRKNLYNRDDALTPAEDVLSLHGRAWRRQEESGWIMTSPPQGADFVKLEVFPCWLILEVTQNKAK